MSLYSKEFLFRIAPKCFIHVLDSNTNITRLEIGPQTFIRKDHEIIVSNVSPMINVSPNNYCEIENPVVKDEKGNVVYETNGEIKLKFGDTEIRLSGDPFPLYPGEIVKVDVTPLRIIKSNKALKLKALMNINENGVDRFVGDEWLFIGPDTYIPKKGIQVLNDVSAHVMKVNTALRLKATREFTDRLGKFRVVGEEWLLKKLGSYIPDAYEAVVGVVKGVVLTEKTALHLKATKTFVDEFGISRRSGEEWIIYFHDSEVHIPGVYEEVVAVLDITTLNSRQYCVVLDPVNDTGRPQLGRKKLVKGEKSFFLLPGERLENGIKNIIVLSEYDGLILRAVEEFVDNGQKRLPGDHWLIRGPTDFIPPIGVEIVDRRTSVALSKNEGIYVRDVNVGSVRCISGITYMLTENEELWGKELPTEVETLLSSSSKQRNVTDKRNKTRVVTYQVPHNAAVQICDFKEGTKRVTFGPDLVMLDSGEQFTLLRLSAGKPKIPDQIKSISLFLGPDFTSDILIVETSDHARLQLFVSYNWYFKIEDSSQAVGFKLFSVPDFIGDACKSLASQIREAVAVVTFDDFHKNSSLIIRLAVFGLDEHGEVRVEYLFRKNNFVITNIDIQSVKPIDNHTQESLQKSVQIAIDITTKSQEAAARHEAESLEQQSRGHLEKQMINDQLEAESALTKLLHLKATSALVECTGGAVAEAQSKAESLRIAGHAAVEQAKLRCQAAEIEANHELCHIIAQRKADIEYKRQQNTLLEQHLEEMAKIDINEFSHMVDSIGKNTLVQMVKAGPEADRKLLKNLGMETTLVTDGRYPINLFKTANGLIGKSFGNGLYMHGGEKNNLE